MTQILLNNISTTLASAVAAGDVTINVAAGDGAKFALATGGNTIRATLVKISGFKEIAWEIVDFTAQSTDALTAVRAREGTTALTFAIGDLVDVRFTAANPVVAGSDVSTAWTPYTPTATTITGTFGALTVDVARYKILGRMLFVTWDCHATVATGSPYDLQLSFPAGVSGAGVVITPAMLNVNGVEKSGALWVNTSTYAGFREIGSTVLTGVVYVRGSFCIEIA